MSSFASLNRRASALEAAADPGFRPWHRVLVDGDEGGEDAIARYCAEHGVARDESFFIVRFVV